ncbi:flagellar hook protein FlgE [Scandinavium sp. NPDC088450]|uniref:flagellar hook protein FlgE n=1 Tax=Scandinavium sp. NPDC088450 TaxID=3364514 RepID=UPI00384FA93B
MGFSQGLSGLKAASKALDVVGNNIANSQTAGFKAGSVAFADIFAGGTGLGVQVGSVTQNFKDGGLTTGNSALDMGITGRGFFRMQTEGGGVFYGRNGQFEQDKNGNIISSTNGLFLTGYQASGTPPVINPGSPIGPIRIPSDDMPPLASTAGSLTGNLPAGDTDLHSKADFDYKDENTFNYQSQVEAFDSLGNKHTIKIYYVQTAAGEWTAYSRNETSPTGPNDGLTELDLEFDTNGKLKGPNTKLTVNGAAFNGSNPLGVEIDFASITKYDNSYSTKLDKIDGYGAGKMLNFTVGKSGEVVVVYSNGERQNVAQVVMADFANSGGLASEGNNLWSETPQSGQPFFGTSGTSTFGTISGGMLEQSNVELGDEMVNMIVFQRNYQSNSQTIKTQSELLQTLVNLR